MMNERTIDELKARLAEIEAEVKGTKVDKTATDEKKEKIYNSAFWEHMHTGMPSNALKEGSDGAGGYLVPNEFDDRLVKAFEDKKIMRAKEEEALRVLNISEEHFDERRK